MVWTIHRKNGNIEYLKPISKAGLTRLVLDFELDFRSKLNMNDPFLESLKVKIPLHENYKSEFPDISKNSLVLKNAGIANAIFIPVNFGSQGFGLLNICTLSERPFDFHEIQILERISENISLSLRFSDSEQANSLNKWKLAKINSELELLNEVNDIILREKNEERLLNETFELILSRTKYKLAWFSWFETESLPNLILVPQIIWGETAYAEALSLDFSNPMTLKGPTAIAAFTGNTGLVNSTLSSPEYILWRENAAKFGLKSSIALCLNINPSKKGLVGIYSGFENAFDEHEVEVLERIMKNLSFALNSIYESKGKEDFRHSLELSNQQLRDYKFALDKSALVSLTDINGLILDCNENFLKISGYQKEEIIGLSHQVINSNYHSKQFWKDLWDTILEGKIWNGEIKNKSKDGSFYWLDTTIIPIKNENGEMHQFLAIRYDITSNKNLLERNQFISFLVDSTEDSIISLNVDGLITSWNNGAERIFGYTSEEAEQRLIFELIPADNANAENDFLSKLNSSTKISETFELNRKKKDGTLVPLSITLSSIEDFEGNLIGVSEIARDISKIKEAEIEFQNQIKFLKDLSYIHSFEIKQEVSKLRTMAQYVAENFRDKIEIEDIIDQAKRSFNKLNLSLEKMNVLISSPLRKSENSNKISHQKHFNNICIIDEDENHSAHLLTVFERIEAITNVRYFSEVSHALEYLKRGDYTGSCLIILDPETEHKKGWEFLKQQELLRFNTDILLVSNKIDEMSVERAKDYRNVGNYILKPLQKLLVDSILNTKILIWNRVD